jgi:hypothetical protein
MWDVGGMLLGRAWDMGWTFFKREILRRLFHYHSIFF